MDEKLEFLAGLLEKEGLRLVASIGLPRLYAVVRDTGTHTELMLNYRTFPQVEKWAKDFFSTAPAPVESDK